MDVLNQTPLFYLIMKVWCSLFQKGNTPLHVGALMGHTDMVKLFLRSGAEINLQSDCHGVCTNYTGTAWYMYIVTCQRGGVSSNYTPKQ